MSISQADRAFATEQREKREQHAVARAAKIFAHLKTAAELGNLCPSNRQLAERFGVSCGLIASAIHFIASSGMIEIVQTANPRIVKIVATGKITAGTPRPKGRKSR